MITPAIDVNVSLGFWPFQRFVTRSAAALASHLRRCGIRRGLVSAIESMKPQRNGAPAAATRTSGRKAAVVIDNPPP